MFKKFCVIILVSLLALPVCALGQTWVTANQSTISWDAVTTLSNGSVIPDTSVIEYNVYLCNAVTDPGKTNPTLIETVSDLQSILTLVNEGQYFVGVQTVRKFEGEVISESAIGWTDNPDIVLNGEIFGITYFLPPVMPTGIRPLN